MQCPRCRSELQSRNWEADIAVDECVSCSGIWLDKGELNRIEDTIERDYSEQLSQINLYAQAYEMARQQAEPGRCCPHCDGELQKKEYAYCSQVIIELCPQCGIWLDKGELEALEKFFERENERSSEEESSDLRRAFSASLAAMFAS